MRPSFDDQRDIELVKAQYCRMLDLKEWEKFLGLFVDDFVSDTSQSGGTVIQGADNFVAFLQKTLAKAVTVHQVQQPEIDLTTETTATGTWAMLDVIRFRPGITLHGFGHYLETYQKIDDQWRIKTSRLTRLREEIRTRVGPLFVSNRLRSRLQKLAPRLTN